MTVHINYNNKKVEVYTSVARVDSNKEYLKFTLNDNTKLLIGLSVIKSWVVY